MEMENDCGPGPMSPSQLIGGSLALIIAFGFVAYRMANKRYREKNGKNLSVREWFNGQHVTKKGVIIGMASGIVFGFIDNFGLYMGMSALDPYFKKLPGGNYANVNAGLGNTFSDAIGSFLGTFIGNAIADYYEVYDYPIWSEAVGIIIGCLLGVYIPYFYFLTHGKKTTSGICGLGATI